MLVYDLDEGIKEVKTKRYWGIFLYDPDEDTNKIEKKHPLVYESYDLLQVELKKSMKDWEHYQIVIRSFEALIP